MEEMMVKNVDNELLESVQGSLTSDLLIKADVDKVDMRIAVSDVYAIENSYKNYKSCYSDLVEKVAKAVHSNALDVFQDVKSYNELVIKVTGCARSTASELVKVASKLYTTTMIVDEENDDFQNVVSQIDDRLDGYTFSEQVMLSNLNEDQLSAVLDELDEEEHTRDEVRKAVKAVKGDTEPSSKKRTTPTKDEKIERLETALTKISGFVAVKSGSRKDLITQIECVLGDLYDILDIVNE